MRRKWIALAAVLALLAALRRPKEDAKAQPAPSATAAQAKPPAKTEKKLVNLNAASAKELKACRGSDEEAARIIAGRPYNSKAFLVTNNVISAGRYEGSRPWSWPASRRRRLPKCRAPAGSKRHAALVGETSRPWFPANGDDEQRS
jgi:hypothetical protein